MNIDDIKEVLLPNKAQVIGKNKLEIFKKIGVSAGITDFAILLGGSIENEDRKVCYDDTLKGRSNWWWTRTSDSDGDVRCQTGDYVVAGNRTGGIRPLITLDDISKIGIFTQTGYNGVLEAELGEYPQDVVDGALSEILENLFQDRSLVETGKVYTTDSCYYTSDASFEPIEHKEYIYNDKRYVRVKANMSQGKRKLSTGEIAEYDKYYWVEVSPITWFVDSDAKVMISKYSIASGVRFCTSHCYSGTFKRTEMYKYLNSYFAKEMISEETRNLTPEQIAELEERMRKMEKRRNPYQFCLDDVTEEDIIRGAIQSGVAVFLHGPSSEGKSARVKAIDPECKVVYLRTATPESLNGKSVYDQKTGKMIDIKPSWLAQLEERCEKEPDKLHVVFFDEITNALPSIQGMAFNIVLDKEVNGIWKLPDNARIVAAGNDMKDSLAANQLAEPLFNRFAHVYIHTTTDGWLKWASEHNIHPSIFAFIAYKKGQPLRSKYTGDKPNADPRKWEMASNMLYATGSPKMLRSLVGEEITKEFVAFCNQRVITIDDVLNDDYTDAEVKALNTAERYSTVLGLSYVDSDNLEKIRDFVGKLGAEFLTIFDSMWIRGDEKRLERIAEAKLAAKEGSKKA